MGEEEQQDNHSHISTNYVNYKIVLSAIFSVLLGAVAVLALVNFGMNVQRKFDGEVEAEEKKEHITEIIAVDYQADTFGYTVLEGSESLLKKLEVGENESSYTVISKDELGKVTEAIAGYGGASPFYQIEDSFFNSSSVIVVPLETAGLTDLQVKSVTRDENYNIQIDLASTKDKSVADVSGRVVFVKLSNIQPSYVTINID
ncbi:hypothetical protein IKX12_00880 [Candidatus Saccharibacteria bacterium]|nr:hypothetical protein [Candidatus Saccharibacteria bacterium]